MASAFTHAIAGVAIGTALGPRYVPTRFWIICATAAALPDLDGVGFWLGVPYESAFGHRGFTHSLFFAALLASVALLAFRDLCAAVLQPAFQRDLEELQRDASIGRNRQVARERAHGIAHERGVFADVSDTHAGGRCLGAGHPRNV